MTHLFYYFYFFDRYKLFFIVPSVLAISLLCFQIEVSAMAVDPPTDESVSNYVRQGGLLHRGNTDVDWYAQDRSREGVAVNEDDVVLFSNRCEPSKVSSFYIGLKKKMSWYLWNRYSNKYDSYAEFKGGVSINRSISSDFKRLFGSKK